MSEDEKNRWLIADWDNFFSCLALVEFHTVMPPLVAGERMITWLQEERGEVFAGKRQGVTTCLSI
jgi:hypothetical protein